MTLRLPTLSVLLLLSAFSQGEELTGVRAPAATECPTPEQARAKMTVPEGYEVRCFAHEPMVVNPVAMSWDARGRLWVVEAFEYPKGTPLPEEQRPFGGVAKDADYHPMPKLAAVHPLDRVVILEDTDGDGVADKRTVFVEGLNLASAIICGDDGIYVGQQPHLLHIRDTNHDDIPDDWSVVLTGFGRADTHELMNSFGWGPDGWLYLTEGVFTNSSVRRPGTPEKDGFQWNAGIARVKPATGTFEVFADGTSNPWGCDFDARGNFFISACVIDHFFHMSPGGIYVRQGGAPENPYSYGLLPSIVDHRHFRAAYAGIQVYQGGVYPKDTWGHAFIGNIHDNAIHEEVLKPVGATFVCETRRDFLRANDGWFRPVSTQTGPDGNLWVMDWCDKYPCYQNALANPEGVDRDRGRIWRVVRTGAPAPVVAKKLADSSDVELAEKTADSNNWNRRMARRLLAERSALKPLDEKALAALRTLFEKHSDPAIRLEALWTLNRCNAAGDLLVSRSKDSDPGIRQWCARLLGEASVKPNATVAPDAIEALTRLASDEDAQVQAAAATALRQGVARWLTVERESAGKLPGALPAADAWKIASALIRKTATQKEAPIQQAVWMAIEPLLVAYPGEGLEQLAILAPATEPLSQVLSNKAMHRLCDTHLPANVDLALAYVARLKGHDPLLAAALSGLVQGQEARAVQPTAAVSALLGEWAASSNAEIRKQAQSLGVIWGDEKAISALIASMANEKTPEPQRIEALGALRKLRSPVAKTGYANLWTASKPSGRLLTELLRAAPDLGGDDTAPKIVALWAALDSGERLAATDALMARPVWARALLDAVADGRIVRATLPPTTARNFAASPDVNLKKRAEEILGVYRESNADTKALIAQKKTVCLEGEPNLANGKALFQATCMVCHTFHGGGQKVGPELIGSGRSNLDALLANVIDPNQIIGNGYENIIITTKDGRTMAGRVTEDTTSQVKLLMIGGQETVIARADVASQVNTKQSLMPTGFGALPDDTFRDLIWYVLAPPEEGPLTAEKRKLLSASMDAPKTAAPKAPATDWESISLWNPDWKVAAPEFERTPVKLPEFKGRNNVLLIHPFPDKKTPATLERKLTVDPKKAHLVFGVTGSDSGDWQLEVSVDGRSLKSQSIGHDEPRWKVISLDLAAFAGKEITVRLEAHASGWASEFAYFNDVRFE